MNVSITQILRPIRLAFLIQPKKQSYLRAIKVSSSLWGGQYFPILPIFKRFTKEIRTEYQLYDAPITFYSNSLQNFDPDYLITDEGVDQIFIDKIKGDRKVVSMDEIEQAIGEQTKYGIAIEDIISSLKKLEFKYQRTDNLKIVLPQIKQRDLFSATLYGTVNKIYLEKIKAISIPKKCISFPKISIVNHHVLEESSLLHFLRLGCYSIYNSGSPFWSSRTAIFIIDPARLLDLMNVWNLRALGWNLIVIPYNDYKEHYYINLIKKQQEDFNKGGDLIGEISVLKGYSVEEKHFATIYQFLNAQQFITGKKIKYSYQWWFPRFWLDRDSLHFDKSASVLIRSEAQNHTLNINDELRLAVLSPKFGEKYISHIAPRFVNEIIYEFDDTTASYAQVIPSISSKELETAIKGSGFYQWRFSEKGIFFLCQGQNKYLHFSIPKAKDVFDLWFKERGFNLEYSAAGKLSNQLLRNIGGIYGTNFFPSTGILKILALFENGNIVNSRTLFGELSRQRGHFREKELKYIVEKLLTKNIIQLGVSIQCTLCNQNSFYTLNEFKEVIKCFVCHNNFKPPMHSPQNDIVWSYRGIGPFSRNNKSEGIIAVLLTLRFFRIAMHPNRSTSILSFDLLKEAERVNEVDFAVFHKKYDLPNLFFCECKTGINFSKKDIERMENLGKLFPGCILVFATLKFELTNEEKDLIIPLVKKFSKGLGSRPTNPVLILTGNELLKQLGYDHKIRHLIISHMSFSDEIGHLCDVTNQYYLGLPSYSAEVAKRWEEKRKNH